MICRQVRRFEREFIHRLLYVLLDTCSIVVFDFGAM